MTLYEILANGERGINLLEIEREGGVMCRCLLGMGPDTALHFREIQMIM